MNVVTMDDVQDQLDQEKRKVVRQGMRELRARMHIPPGVFRSMSQVSPTL